MIFSIFASKHLIERSTVHVDGRTNWKNKPVKRDLTWPLISRSSCSIWFPTTTWRSYYPLYSSPQGRWWWPAELRSLRPFQRRSLSRCPCSRWTWARKYVWHINSTWRNIEKQNEKYQRQSFTWKAETAWSGQRELEEQGSRGWRGREERWRSRNRAWQILQQRPDICICICICLWYLCLYLS